MKQYTYLMLKPDAFQGDNEKKIMKMIENHGLSIESFQKIEVDMDVMKILLEHYRHVIDDKGPEFDFPSRLFQTFYFHGPHYIMPMKVSYDGKEDIIPFSRQLIGKTNPIAADKETIRGMFSQDSYELADQEGRLVNNVIHGSDSPESAQRELNIWKQYL